jgi:hypothetical protein
VQRLRHTLSLADFQFFFLNQQQVTIDGTFAECVPTKNVQPCYPGFKSDSRAYFILTDDNILMKQTEQGHFRVMGKFTSSMMEEKYPVTDVVGTIEVRSITPI